MEQNSPSRKNRLKPLLFPMILYLFGYLFGCIGVLLVTSEKQISFSEVPFGILSDPHNDFGKLFSESLFEFLPAFLVVFPFGLTYLGTVVIPAVLCFQGITQGIAHTSFLIHFGLFVFLQKGITYMPAAALNLTVLLLFSVKARHTARILYRQLRGCTDAEIALKPYLFHSAVSLFAFTGISVLRCVLGLLETTLF